MRRAVLSDRSTVVDILVRSFDDNKSVNHVIKQDAIRKRRINTLMAYSFDVCFKFGKIWISDDGAGCALVLYPDKRKTTIESLIWDVKLAFGAIGISRVGHVI